LLRRTQADHHFIRPHRPERLPRENVDHIRIETFRLDGCNANLFGDPLPASI
jgi:hypothetical protein